MARPRKISDEELLAACGRAIGRHGAGFTLAQVATEAGVAVGTVSGRFGSKHGLLNAMTATAAAGIEARMRTAAAAHTDPVDAVTAAVLVTAAGLGDPGTTGNHLARLGADLANPELRDGLGELRERVRRALARMITVEEFPGAPPPARAARILASLAHGVALDWSLRPRGRLADRLRADVRTVLEPWRRAG